MSQESALEYLTKKLDEQRDRIKEHLIETELKESEYLRLRGLAQGLTYAKELIQDLAKRLEDGDE